MDADHTTPRPQRRWFRFSLRTLLLVILVLSVWLGYMANQAAKQRRAVALVLELGGVAFYDCQKPTTTGGNMGANFITLGRPSMGGRRRTVGIGGGLAGNISRQAAQAPLYEPPPDDDFLHKYVDHDWFHDVVHVRLVGPDVNNEQLGKVVDGLPSIVRLTLRRCSITDAGLEHVASLERLESIIIESCDVTANGVDKLRSQRLDVQVHYKP